MTLPNPRALLPGIVACALAFPAVAQHAHHHQHDNHDVDAAQEIGAMDFNVSCDASVGDDFDRALGLMHHMMYGQARALFEQILEADPDCAMAHWGIAQSLFQPLWPDRPDRVTRERGWQHLEQARTLGAGTDREAALVDATRAFFRHPEDDEYWPRIHRWADAMRSAHDAHPEDLDIAALFGLSLIATGLAADREDASTHFDEAETVLRDVWKRENAHPGAIHYSIHATDVDGRAENALDLVASYGDIAPEVSHALHMLSHIYVRVGDWPEVVRWNRRSADAALRDSDEGVASRYFVHAIDYMVYGYLQQGRDDDARAAAAEMLDSGRRVDAAFTSAFHAAAIPARLAVERRDWAAAAEIETRSPDHLPWDGTFWPEGLSWYARGLGAVHSGDVDAARAAESRLAALAEDAHGAGESQFATYIEVDRQILAGWIAHAEGDADAAIDLIRDAADLEASVQKHPVTPGALAPPNEALGDLLLALERPEDALTAYREAERIWPGRFNTLLGAARAAAATGDEAAAQGYYRRLLEQAGESSREALAEARDRAG